MLCKDGLSHWMQGTAKCMASGCVFCHFVCVHDEVKLEEQRATFSKAMEKEVQVGR